MHLPFAAVMILSSQLSGMALFFLLGLSSLIPGMMFSRAGLIEYTKALAGIDRDRSRDVSHDKDSKGGRERDRESCSSSHNR